MSLSLDAVRWLASSAGAALLDHLARADLSPANELRLITALRRHHDAAQAAAALELARLRQAAVGKFGDAAARMFFTRAALEQASDPLIRAWRAASMAGISISDACCGIGADSLAFAAASACVTGVDLDAVRVEMARLNAAALDLDARFVVGDVRDGLPPADLVFFDPARRAGDKRLFDVEAYQPPLSTVRAWNAPRVLVKLSPGVELAQLDAYHGALRFISVDGELKEALLSIDAESHGKTRAALMLFSAGEAHTMHIAVEAFATPPIPAEVGEPRAYLVEPDAAIIRAGLVGEAARAVNGVQPDGEIAYFTTDSPPAAPYLKAWRIRAWMPFNLKKLRAHLNAHNIRRATIKKRGTAIMPEDLIARLKLRGSGDAVTLVITRLRGSLIALICDEMPVRAGS